MTSESLTYIVEIIAQNIKQFGQLEDIWFSLNWQLNENLQSKPPHDLHSKSWRQHKEQNLASTNKFTFTVVETVNNIHHHHKLNTCGRNSLITCCLHSGSLINTNILLEVIR